MPPIVSTRVPRTPQMPPQVASDMTLLRGGQEGQGEQVGDGGWAAVLGPSGKVVATTVVMIVVTEMMFCAMMKMFLGIVRMFLRGRRETAM